MSESVYQLKVTLHGIKPFSEDETSLEQAAKAKSKLRYEYDFGDDWQHDIVVERVDARSPDEPAIACVAGKRSGPPEDSGGPWGYMETVKAFADESHEDHADIRDWLGDDFDPEAFDIDRINAKLAKAFRLPTKKKNKKTAPFSPSLH